MENNVIKNEINIFKFGGGSFWDFFSRFFKKIKK